MLKSDGLSVLVDYMYTNLVLDLHVSNHCLDTIISWKSQYILCICTKVVQCMYCIIYELVQGHG